MRRSNRTTSGLHASRSLLHGESNFTATSASSLEQDDSFLPWPSVNLPPPRRRVAGSGQQHAALSDPNKIPLSPSSSRVESTGLLGHSTSLSLTFPKIHRKNVSDPTSLRTRSPLVGVDFDPSSLSRTGTTSNPDVGNIAADSLMGQLYSNMRATKASHQADIHAQEASHQSDLQESEATHQAAQKTLVDRNTQLENKLKGGARYFERDELPILRYGAAGIVAKALGLNPRSLESRDLQQVASALLPYLEQQSGSGGAAGIEKARIQAFVGRLNHKNSITQRSQAAHLESKYNNLSSFLTDIRAYLAVHNGLEGLQEILAFGESVQKEIKNSKKRSILRTAVNSCLKATMTAPTTTLSTIHATLAQPQAIGSLGGPSSGSRRALQNSASTQSPITPSTPGLRSGFTGTSSPTLQPQYGHPQSLYATQTPHAPGLNSGSLSMGGLSTSPSGLLQSPFAAPFGSMTSPLTLGSLGSGMSHSSNPYSLSGSMGSGMSHSLSSYGPSDPYSASAPYTPNLSGGYSPSQFSESDPFSPLSSGTAPLYGPDGGNFSSGNINAPQSPYPFSPTSQTGSLSSPSSSYSGHLSGSSSHSIGGPNGGHSAGSSSHPTGSSFGQRCSGGSSRR